ncbi:unnamed protein product [Amoebophrya sp. A25]|nr:unnamed protein product [Amoebophrya sp. A25]|eukprot:GSA25T00014142001.1
MSQGIILNHCFCEMKAKTMIIRNRRQQRMSLSIKNFNSCTRTRHGGVVSRDIESCKM